MATTAMSKIESNKARIKELENQNKQLLQKAKQQERKDRTRRLIERGALLESMIDGALEMSNEQIKIFLEKTVGNDFGKRMLARIVAQGGESGAEETSHAQQGNSHASAQAADGGKEQGG